MPRAVRLLPLLAAALLLVPLTMASAQGTSAPAAAPSTKRSHYIYVLKLAPRLYDQKAWTEADNAAVGKHFARLKQATGEEHLARVGRTTEALDKTFGLVVFEA